MLHAICETIIQNKFLKTKTSQLVTLQRTEVISFCKSLRSIPSKAENIAFSIIKNYNIHPVQFTKSSYQLGKTLHLQFFLRPPLIYPVYWLTMKEENNKQLKKPNKQNETCDNFQEKRCLYSDRSLRKQFLSLQSAHVPWRNCGQATQSAFIWTTPVTRLFVWVKLWEKLGWAFVASKAG